MPNVVNGESTDSLIVCKTSQGIEIRGTVLKFTRFVAVFEIYNATSVLRLSEVLQDFRIIFQNRTLYSGRAVVRGLIDTGPATVCEATLEDAWLDVGFASPEGWQNRLREDFSQFISASQKTFRILPEFKVAVADLQTLLLDLRIWLEQVELGVRSQPSGDRHQFERQTILEVQEPIVAMAAQVLEKFELIAQQVEPEARAAHMSYMKRQIHPLVLCAPFIHRTFYKPLGYAGDYEMVNMMVRDPYEGASIFAKLLNRIFLNTPPVEAHRNRITYLTQMLQDETLLALRKGRSINIFNLGCGPAKEIQDFLTHSDISDRVQLRLLDFNKETLAYTSGVLANLKRQHARTTRIDLVEKSVHQILKEAHKFQSSESKFDVVYCAGLFDYLSDQVCKKLVQIFYDMVAPGGLVVVTNVDASNPSRNWMEYVLDWHLIYRDPQRFRLLVPERVKPDAAMVRSVGTGVNIVLEMRKPDNG